MDYGLMIVDSSRNPDLHCWVHGNHWQGFSRDHSPRARELRRVAQDKAGREGVIPCPSINFSRYLVVLMKLIHGFVLPAVAARLVDSRKSGI